LGGQAKGSKAHAICSFMLRSPPCNYLSVTYKISAYLLAIDTYFEPSACLLFPYKVYEWNTLCEKLNFSSANDAFKGGSRGPGIEVIRTMSTFCYPGDGKDSM
jgi:hypothetical protein